MYPHIERLLVAGLDIPRRKLQPQSIVHRTFSREVGSSDRLVTKSGVSSSRRPCALVKAFDRLVHRYNYDTA